MAVLSVAWQGWGLAVSPQTTQPHAPWPVTRVLPCGCPKGLVLWKHQGMCGGLSLAAAGPHLPPPASERPPTPPLRGAGSQSASDRFKLLFPSCLCQHVTDPSGRQQPSPRC